MKPNIVRFNKETAPFGHNKTILAGPVLPEDMTSPFKHAWGYLHDKSMMEGHSHKTEEIYMVFQGEGFVHLGEEKFPVSAGDIIEIPVDLYHTMSCEDGHALLWAALWWPAQQK